MKQKLQTLKVALNTDVHKMKINIRII